MPINNARMCCAKSRFSVTGLCRQPAMKNKQRCRMHGGKSTGPRTPEGTEKCARSNYKHGFYTNVAIAERRMMRTMINDWHYNDIELE